MGEQQTLMDVARLFDPARLTQARRICKLGKAELHQMVGVSGCPTSGSVVSALMVEHL